jgi:hypothetical protein
MRRKAVFLAFLCAFAVIGAIPAGASEPTRVLIAFVPTEPAPKSPLLFDLAERDFAYGMASPSIGAYSKRQMVLDMSQGSPTALTHTSSSASTCASTPTAAVRSRASAAPASVPTTRRAT